MTEQPDPKPTPQPSEEDQQKGFELAERLRQLEESHGSNVAGLEKKILSLESALAAATDSKQLTALQERIATLESAAEAAAQKDPPKDKGPVDLAGAGGGPDPSALSKRERKMTHWW